MEHNQVYSGGTFVTNFQVTRMGTIPLGNFNITISGQKQPFLIKNITEDNVEVEIVPAGQTAAIITVLYPGWNVEIVNQVNNAPDDTLQYGF